MSGGPEGKWPRIGPAAYTGPSRYRHAVEAPSKSGAGRRGLPIRPVAWKAQLPPPHRVSWLISVAYVGAIAAVVAALVVPDAVTTDESQTPSANATMALVNSTTTRSPFVAIITLPSLRAGIRRTGPAGNQRRLVTRIRSS
jgi:hypothetical protein